MTASADLCKSLNALVDHVERGEIRDTALPGSPPAEAMRLVKNGVSVSAFSGFEHFIRTRVSELLNTICSHPQRPQFTDLPIDLRTAATMGVVEALRFQLSPRQGKYTREESIARVIAEAADIASLRDHSYTLPGWSFGHSGSNVTAGTLTEFLKALGLPNPQKELADTLDRIGFDTTAAGLRSESGELTLKDAFVWRHTAAHDAQVSIDAEVLITRITGYIAIATAFDYLATRATSKLLVPGGTSPTGIGYLDFPSLDGTSPPTCREMSKDAEEAIRHAFTPAAARAALAKDSIPPAQMIVIRDQRTQPRDWFFT